MKLREYFVHMDFIKNTLNCVPKMNEGLMGLERHEAEQLMTEFYVNYNFKFLKVCSTYIARDGYREPVFFWTGT